MKAMITGFVAVALIGVAAYYGLHAMGFSTADMTTSGGSVRLD